MVQWLVPSGQNSWLLERSHDNTDTFKSTSMLSDPGNYKPISLTCIFCKLLEKCIYGLMYEHLSNYHLLSNSQWGFCSGCSTVTVLLSVTKEWLSAIEYSQEVCAVFFDYRKALTVSLTPWATLEIYTTVEPQPSRKDVHHIWWT